MATSLATAAVAVTGTEVERVRRNMDCGILGLLAAGEGWGRVDKVLAGSPQLLISVVVVQFRDNPPQPRDGQRQTGE
jgi:hypothetical protein